MPARAESGGPSILVVLVIVLIIVIVAVTMAIIKYSKTHPRIEGDKTRGSIGYGFLGFFVPIAGFVIFLVWREKEPGNSKVAGIGSLIGLIVWSIVPTVFYFLK